MTLGKRGDGDKVRGIPTRDWNKFVDTANFVDGLRGQEANPTNGDSDGTIVLVKNTTRYNLNRFAVLGIDAPIITPTANLGEFKNRVTFRGSTPRTGSSTNTNIADHTSKFVVLQEGIPSGGIGRAIISGVTHVKVKVETDTENSTTAGIGDNESEYLVAGGSGAEILWRESGKGYKWATVRMGNTRTRRLARTCAATDDGTYPNDYDGIDTFWCKFVDADYSPDAQGNSAATFTNPTDGPRVLAHARNGNHFSENTIIPIELINGKWWIDWRPTYAQLNVDAVSLVKTAAATVGLTGFEGISGPGVGDHANFSVASDFLEIETNEAIEFDVYLHIQFSPAAAISSVEMATITLQKRTGTGGSWTDQFYIYLPLLPTDYSGFSFKDQRNFESSITLEPTDALRVRCSATTDDKFSIDGGKLRLRQGTQGHVDY